MSSHPSAANAAAANTGAAADANANTAAVPSAMAVTAAKADAIVIDLAFNREPDPHLDATSTRSAVAPSPMRGGVELAAPTVVRLLPDGHTAVAAPDVALSATPPPPRALSHTNGAGADADPDAPSPKRAEAESARAKRAVDLEKRGLAVDSEGRNPEERASLLSRLWVSFASALIALGNERPLDTEDMGPISKADRTARCNDALSSEFRRRKAHDPSAGVFGTCLAMYRSTLFRLFLLEIPSKADSLIQPIFLNHIISWIADPEQDTYIGYAFTCAMLASGLLSNFAFTLWQEYNVHAMLQIRAGISGMVYDKSLRLSSAGRKDSPIGEIVNLLSSDSEKVAMGCSFGVTSCILVPVQVALNIYFIYQELGPSTFAGLGVLFVILPILFVIIMKTMTLYERKSSLGDQRVKLTTEVLQGIRVVKFYGWETSFEERLSAIRNEELLVLRDLNGYSTAYILAFQLMPVFMALSAFGTYIGTGHDLDVSTVFSALAYFNALQLPLLDLPMGFSQLAQGGVSSTRLSDFFAQPEITDARNGNGSGNVRDTTIAIAPATGTTAVGPALEDSAAFPLQIAGGEFRWDPASKAPTLSDINFRAAAGKLTAIVGKVGSGKTSLISALLSEIGRTSGVVCVTDRISLVGQTAWIQNLSLQENIQFGLPYDRARFEATVKATALDADIAILPAGQHTEIGEKGINLSGGQKQRVALSRAVYSAYAPAAGSVAAPTPTPSNKQQSFGLSSNAAIPANDVIVMDDPLSAVDAHVAEHIFTNCITGDITRGKTRVLVTNQLHFLPRCDYIYVMKDGVIAERGPYSELAATGVVFRELMHTHMNELSKERANKPDGATDEKTDGHTHTDAKHSATVTVPDQKTGAVSDEKKDSSATTGVAPKSDAAPKRERAAGQLVLKEEMSSVAVSMAAYVMHMRAMGSLAWMLVLLLFFVAGQGLTTFSSFWLGWWAEDKFDKNDQYWYMAGYGIIAGATAVMLTGRGLLFAFLSVGASATHHRKLLTRIQRAPASFFDETPVGRILNRFSKDMDDVDNGVPQDLSTATSVIAMVLAGMIAITIVTPYFAIALVVVSVVFYRIQRYYKAAALQTERVSAVSRSPILQNFTETLNGVLTIRAYGAQERFRLQNHRLTDVNTQATYMARLVFRWASVRTGVLNAALTFFAALFICIQRNSISSGLAGVALTNVLQIGGFFAFLLQTMTELENKMNSVERVHEYSTDKVPNEAVWTVPGEPALPRDAKTGATLEWPSNGRVDVKEMVMSYRPALEPAIKGLNVRFNAHEKIGVAGRTGSGKSSLMLCLFRMYELKSGSIEIDGVDISKIGLHTLRKRLAIIPQDPIVFSGTIRDNLDPFREFSDADIERVLSDVHLKAYVDKQEKKMNAPVSEYGENLSVGQCQLICIARALLRKPKIILMDEATSSIDSITDALIQKTVADNFANATVITIAHRLNTIMDANRILVMKDGRAAEFDSPSRLIASGGLFASMHKSMASSGSSPASASASAGASGAVTVPKL